MSRTTNSLAAKLTLDKRRELARQARLEQARRHYVNYVELVHHGKWERARHLALVCDKIPDVAKVKTKRLMIFMPPRHGKSMTVTKTFPSYFLGKNPNKRVIEVSYGEDLAQSFGASNRDKIMEFGQELFGISVSQVQSKKTNWNIEDYDGGMISVGVGGGITGNGADLLIIDDPIKNREEAESPTYRKKLYDEYRSSILTRLHAGAAIIIILTRWQEDDLAGTILKTGEPWDIISLPALCDDEENDLLGRKEGEALWPEGGYDEEWMQDMKRSLGSYVFTSLYQQRPAPPEGGIIKRGWFKFYKTLPEGLMGYTQSWDCTFKDNKDSDFVVGQLWAKKGPDRYLITQIRGRMTFTETLQSIRLMSHRYPQSIRKLIEDKANGSAVIEVLKKEFAGILPVEPEGGKFARAAAASPVIESGNVWLPDPSIAPWVMDYVEEFAVFPNGAHDDQVDSTTQYINYDLRSGFNINSLI